MSVLVDLINKIDRFLNEDAFNFIGQNNFIKIKQALGYPGNNEGICAGITQVWVQSLIYGKERQFVDMIYFIEDICHEIDREVAKEIKRRRW